MNKNCKNNTDIKNCTQYNLTGCAICNNNYFSDLQNYCTTTTNCNISLLSNQSCILCVTNYYLDSNLKCFNVNTLINCNLFVW